jgi:hypothetical protein
MPIIAAILFAMLAGAIADGGMAMLLWLIFMALWLPAHRARRRRRAQQKRLVA